MIRLLILLAFWALPVQAERIVLGLSAEEVPITATFDGSKVLVFGAIARDAPAPTDPPIEVIVTIAGPATPVVMREKARRFGIWMNAKSVEIDAAPSFYAVATTAPLAESLSDTEDLRQSITIPRAIRSIGNEVDNTSDFVDALIRIRIEQGQYRMMEGAVELDQATLFRTEVALPANLIEGRYTVRIFLTRGGMLVDRFETGIAVYKVGIERWLFNLAMRDSLLYGLLAVALAISAGWAASVAFQSWRR